MKSSTLARAWCHLGYVEWAQGEPGPATGHCRRGLALSRRIGDSVAALQALQQLAQISFDMNDLAGARRRLASAITIAREANDPAQLADCLRRLGQIDLAEERWDKAESQLHQALELARRAEDAEVAAVTTIVLGRLHIRQRRLEAAERILSEGLAGLRDHGAPRQTAHLLESLAAAAAAQGDGRRAGCLAGAAAAAFDTAGAGRPEGTPLHAPVVALWRSAVSTDEGRRAWSEGQAMGLREAIDFALRAPPVVPPARAGPSKASALTRRQLEIAGLVASGLSNRQIAAALHISERTAEGHIEQICNRLGFGSRVQVAAWYIQNELAEGGRS